MPNYKIVNNVKTELTNEEQATVDAGITASLLERPERDLFNLRKKRNELLAETDYLALSDNTLSDEMTTYRQALRDITDTYSSLNTVVWPTKP
ncbi:phage tail assembly chaperone [Planctomycetota bacterium]|nr:phage tail assembly chaperone [Planctomycetota bacterium]